MKKILFPTDFSNVSINAFIYALKLADSINAEIITMHAYQLPQANYINVAEYLHEIYDVSELSNFENYKDEIPVLRRIAEENNLNHIKISHALILGNLIEEIQKITKHENIDFIVMGTKGATGLKETIFGTMAIKVMNDVKAVVLVIQERCKYEPFKKLLFITEYQSDDVQSFLKVKAFAKIFQAHIDCLQVVPQDHEDNNKNMHHREELMDDSSIKMHSVTGNDVEGIILNFIDSHKINMIAMHVHHKNFYEKLFEISLSKKLAFHINIPILAIHE